MYVPQLCRRSSLFQKIQVPSSLLVDVIDHNVGVLVFHQIPRVCRGCGGNHPGVRSPQKDLTNVSIT